jgi:hypothetical protein
MKKGFRIHFLVIFILLICCFSVHAGQKPKVGIMKFDVSENINPALQDFLYATLMDQMVKSQKYTVVDWEEIDRILQYIAKSQPNISEDAARQQALNQLGIQKMYIGSAAKVGSKYYLNVKVLNLDLSVDRTEREPASNEDDLERAIVYIAKLLLSSPKEAKNLQTEKKTWEKIQSNKSEQTLKEFLKKYPDGIYKKTAQGELDKLISVNKKKEATKAKEVSEKKKQEALCDSIAGPWQIISEDCIQFYEGQKYSDNFFISGSIIIHQSGDSISFEHFYERCTEKDNYVGTYNSKTLNAECGRTKISAAIKDDCMTLEGTWTCWQRSSSFIMKRLDPNVDPMKYSNFNPKGGGSAFCFIDTLSE